jgi:hypothetical protein
MCAEGFTAALVGLLSHEAGGITFHINTAGKKGPAILEQALRVPGG